MIFSPRLKELLTIGNSILLVLLTIGFVYFFLADQRHRSTPIQVPSIAERQRAEIEQVMALAAASATSSTTPDTGWIDIVAINSLDNKTHGLGFRKGVLIDYGPIDSVKVNKQYIVISSSYQKPMDINEY
jgi:hypothetical protein